MAHHESPTASIVFTTQTTKKGLWEPSQLTNEKLPMRITTATISIVLVFFRTNMFSSVVGMIFLGAARGVRGTAAPGKCRFLIQVNPFQPRADPNGIIFVAVALVATDRTIVKGNFAHDAPQFQTARDFWRHADCRRANSERRVLKLTGDFLEPQCGWIDRVEPGPSPMGEVPTVIVISPRSSTG